MTKHLDLTLPNPIRVVHFGWNDHEPDWLPAEPYDVTSWGTVSVGDEKGAVDFQVHVCTHAAMHRVQNKRHTFVIDEYSGQAELIRKLDAFLAEKIDPFPGDPYWELARFWKSEYGIYDYRGGRTS